jgi:hypothetical protein
MNLKESIYNSCNIIMKDFLINFNDLSKKLCNFKEIEKELKLIHEFTIDGKTEGIVENSYSLKTQKIYKDYKDYYIQKVEESFGEEMKQKLQILNIIKQSIEKIKILLPILTVIEFQTKEKK